MLDVVGGRRRRPSARPILLGTVAVLAGAVVAYAATRAPTFSVRATLHQVSVQQGKSVTIRVRILRRRGFHRAVRLTVARLPKGTRARWTAPGGRALRRLSGRVALLTLRVPAGAALGRYRPRIAARSGHTVRHATLTLRVVAPATVVGGQPTVFSLSVAPASQLVARGDSAAYTIFITRAPGFTGTVTLGVPELPGGVTAFASPGSIRATGNAATLTVQTAAGTPAGAHELVVTGRARDHGKNVARTATARIVVQQGRAFSIAGDLGTKLYPGTSAPIDLTLTNPNEFALRVANLTVAVSDQTSSPGCGAADNFTATQYGGPYPLTLPPGTSRLSDLVGDESSLPRIHMRNLPSSQDACQNATISLRYSGSATR